MTGVRIKSRTMAVKGRTPVTPRGDGQRPPNMTPGPQILPPSDDGAENVLFTGPWTPLFKLSLKNAFLTLMTFGIYRFWAKANARRYFLHHVVIDGEPLEYTGTARELFIGFLIAVFGLVVFGTAFWFANQAILNIETTDSKNFNSFQILLFFLLYGSLPLLYFSIHYRTWRYRLSRIFWRGIGFSQTGSVFRFSIIGSAWLLLSVLTLGLAVPWLNRALWKYRMNNMRFGHVRFSFDGRRRPPVLPWIATLAGFILFALVTPEAPQYSEINKSSGFTDPIERLYFASGVLLGHYIANFIIFLFIAIPFFWFLFTDTKYALNCLSFNGSNVISQFSTGAAVRNVSFGLMIMFLIISIEVLAYLQGGIWSVSFTTGLGFKASQIVLNVALLFTVALTVLVFRTCVLDYLFAKHLTSALSISALSSFDEVTRSNARAPKHGEGASDALDLAI